MSYTYLEMEIEDLIFLLKLGKYIWDTETKEKFLKIFKKYKQKYDCLCEQLEKNKIKIL